MKKILCSIVAMFMMISCLFVPNVEVYASSISLSTSASSIQIGDNVTVTVTVPENVSGPITVSLSNDVLKYSSSSAKEIGVNGKYMSISIGKYGLEGTNKVTLTFQAQTSGSVVISVSHGDIFDNETFDPVQLGNASTTITVQNKSVEPSGGETTTEVKKSADNSLSSLKLSSGTLSPSFKYNVVKYTATVDYDVTSVVVSAKTSNSKATIESVTGDGTVDLNVGENTIKVVVRAENGVKATYTIVVTRKAGEVDVEPDVSEDDNQHEPEINETLQYNGEQLYMADDIPANIIPTDFESALINVDGKQMEGLSFKKGELKLLYLNNINGAGSLYVYDEHQKIIYPFIKIESEKSYVIVLSPDETNIAIPEWFEKCTFSIEGKGTINAYQFIDEQLEEKEKADDLESGNGLIDVGDNTTEVDASDFHLIYCMNAQGEKGWYIYDSVEGTYQRYFTFTHNVKDEIEEDIEIKEDTEIDVEESSNDEIIKAQFEKELQDVEQKYYVIMGIELAVILILFIVIIVLITKNLSKKEDDFYYEDDDE